MKMTLFTTFDIKYCGVKFLHIIFPKINGKWAY